MMALALVVLMVPSAQAVNSAINGSTVVASGNVTTSTITVTNAGAFPDGDEISSATIKNLDGTAAGATTLTVGGNNAAADTSVLTVATADLTNNQAYIVFFRTTSGDFGSVTVNVGTPTNDRVTVTATVEPTLSFTITQSGGTTALGTLTSSSFNTDAVTLSVSTNATSGADVTMTAAGLTDGTNGIGQTAALAGTEVAGTYYKVSTNAVPSFTTVNGAVTTTNGADMLASQTVYDGTTAVAAASTTVTIGAQATAITPAGNYSDTLTFTATGTF